tara:strand:- start:376 stop:999 length:624 start_codon:yes stop_codon:yes gene_type:complete
MKEYQYKNLKIINADCMDIMKNYSDNYFDLAIVDPPYRDNNQPTKDMRKNGSMKSIVGRPLKNYWDELYRISKDQIIWGANNFQLPQFKGFLVWKKKTISENFTMSMCEIASLSENLGTTSKWVEIAPQDPNRIHPTQKPIKLYNWILKHYGNKDFKILDTHLGSGSSAIACYYFGVKEFVGMEIDLDYYNSSIKRIKQQTAQIKLF